MNDISSFSICQFFGRNETHAADPSRTSRTLIFVDSDSMVENTNTEMITVADVQPRLKGTHRKTDIGIIKIATATNTLNSFAAPVTRIWEKYVTTRSFSLTPCFEEPKRSWIVH